MTWMLAQLCRTLWEQIHGPQSYFRRLRNNRDTGPDPAGFTTRPFPGARMKADVCKRHRLGSVGRAAAFISRTNLPAPWETLLQEVYGYEATIVFRGS